MTSAITVLVVDDHPLVRAGLRALLEREGLVVVADASNASDAVARAGEHRPRVVLLDLTMPGMDAASTIRALLAACPSARVVVLVTFESSAEIARCRAAGAVGAIAKDAKRDAIVASVREAARA